MLDFKGTTGKKMGLEVKMLRNMCGNSIEDRLHNGRIQTYKVILV